jgi:hypothetical protein
MIKIKESTEAALALEHKFLAKTRMWLEDNLESGFVIDDAANLAVKELFEAWANSISSNSYSNDEVARNLMLEVDAVIDKLCDFKIEAQKWL